MMPLQRDHIQFVILFLCVPFQYFFVLYTGSSEQSRSYQLSLLVKQIQEFQKDWFTTASWTKWLKENLLENFEHNEKIPVPGVGESVAKEVLKFREESNSGHFATSTVPRNVRKPHVKYRVGQVIKHKRFGYRGVIVGWDEMTKAPEFWIDQMHGRDKPEWRSQPNYSVLVDTRDREGAQTTYVVQENLEVIKNTKVLNPKVDEHFESFDGSQYISRPWLRTLYPLD